MVRARRSRTRNRRLGPLVQPHPHPPLDRQNGTSTLRTGLDRRRVTTIPADYGVPQARPHLFIVGAARGETVPDLPEPTHSGSWERRPSGAGAEPHVTTGEALADVVATPEAEEVIRGRWGHLLPDIPPGGNYLHYTAEQGHPEPLFDWRSRYWSFLLKLNPERPSPTIQAQPGPNVGPFHWDNRRLRVPELRRLFTFPEAFEFVGKRASVQSQVGNSVPPLLAQRVAERVAAAAK